MKQFLNSTHCRNWIAEFIASLFDLSLTDSIALKILPLIYALAMVALMTATLAFSVQLFAQSIWHGLAYLIFAAPLIFLSGLALFRFILEILSAVFRIQYLMLGMNAGLGKLEHYMEQLSKQMNSMNQHIVQMSNHMEHMRKDFGNVMEVMENIEELTDRIPFIKKQRKAGRDQWAESSLNKRTPSDE